MLKNFDYWLHDEYDVFYLIRESEALIFFLCLSHANYRKFDDFYFQRTHWSSDVIRILKTDLNFFKMCTLDQLSHIFDFFVRSFPKIKNLNLKIIFFCIWFVKMKGIKWKMRKSRSKVEIMTNSNQFSESLSHP